MIKASSSLLFSSHLSTERTERVREREKEREMGRGSWVFEDVSIGRDKYGSEERVSVKSLKESCWLRQFYFCTTFFLFFGMHLSPILNIQSCHI